MLPPQHLHGNQAKLALRFDHLDPFGLRRPLNLSHPWHRLSWLCWLESHQAAGPTLGPVHTLGTLEAPTLSPTQKSGSLPARPTSLLSPPQYPRPHGCLLPCLDKDIKFNVTRDCGASARPAPDDSAVPTDKGRKPSSNWAPDPAPCSQGSLQPHTGPPITRSADTLSRGCLGVIGLCLSLHSLVSSCSPSTHPPCSQPRWVDKLDLGCARAHTHTWASYGSSGGLGISFPELGQTK